MATIRAFTASPAGLSRVSLRRSTRSVVVRAAAEAEKRLESPIVLPSGGDLKPKGLGGAFVIMRVLLLRDLDKSDEAGDLSCDWVQHPEVGHHPHSPMVLNDHLPGLPEYLDTPHTCADVVGMKGPAAEINNGR